MIPDQYQLSTNLVSTLQSLDADCYSKNHKIMRLMKVCFVEMELVNFSEKLFDFGFVRKNCWFLFDKKIGPGAN